MMMKKMLTKSAGDDEKEHNKHLIQMTVSTGLTEGNLI